MIIVCFKLIFAYFWNNICRKRGRIVQYFCKVKKSLQSQEKICNRYKLNIEKTAFLLFLAEMRRFFNLK